MTPRSGILTCISIETHFHQINKADINCFDISERQEKLSNKTIAIRYVHYHPLATSRCLKKWWGEGSLPPFWVVGLTTGLDFTVMTDISAMNVFLVLIFGIHKIIMLYMYAKLNFSNVTTFEVIPD